MAGSGVAHAAIRADLQSAAWPRPRPLEVAGKVAGNTAQIPQDEYARRNRQMNRYRVEILVCAALLLGIFVPLVFFVSSSYVFLAIIVGLAWMFFYMPFWRRRVRRAAASAPRWELTPE